MFASKGGAPTNPDWYYNLNAGPEINVEFGTETFAVFVRELDGIERENVWTAAVGPAPNFANTRTRRRGRFPFCCSRGFAPIMFRTLQTHVRFSAV